MCQLIGHADGTASAAAAATATATAAAVARAGGCNNARGGDTLIVEASNDTGATAAAAHAAAAAGDGALAHIDGIFAHMYLAQECNKCGIILGHAVQLVVARHVQPKLLMPDFCKEEEGEE